MASRQSQRRESGRMAHAMVGVVGAVADFQFVVVAGEFQGGRHLLIGQRPIAELIIDVVFAVLQKDAERLRSGL